MNIQIVFYSMYGHIYRMAEAVAEGARGVSGADVGLYRVPELVPKDVLEKSGALRAQESFKHIPVATVEQLADADGIIFGIPTRYGNMCAQMKNYLDQTGPLWVKGALVGKPGSVFTSSGTQHGGQETTIITTHIVLLHHGMVIVGVPYTEPGISYLAEISGGSPYGASTIAGAMGERMPSENELKVARFQGMHVAEITARLIRA